MTRAARCQLFTPNVESILALHILCAIPRYCRLVLHGNLPLIKAACTNDHFFRLMSAFLERVGVILQGVS